MVPDTAPNAGAAAPGTPAGIPAHSIPLLRTTAGTPFRRPSGAFIHLYTPSTGFASGVKARPSLHPWLHPIAPLGRRGRRIHVPLLFFSVLSVPSVPSVVKFFLSFQSHGMLAEISKSAPRVPIEGSGSGMASLGASRRIPRRPWCPHTTPLLRSSLSSPRSPSLPHDPPRRIRRSAAAAAPTRGAAPHIAAFHGVLPRHAQCLGVG